MTEDKLRLAEDKLCLTELHLMELYLTELCTAEDKNLEKNICECYDEIINICKR